MRFVGCTRAECCGILTVSGEQETESCPFRKHPVTPIDADGQNVSMGFGGGLRRRNRQQGTAAWKVTISCSELS